MAEAEKKSEKNISYVNNVTNKLDLVDIDKILYWTIENTLFSSTWKIFQERVTLWILKYNSGTLKINRHPQVTNTI